MQGCPTQRPPVWPAWGAPAFPAGLGQADAGKKRDAARPSAPIAAVAILSPFAGLFSLRENRLSAKRVPSGPCCGFEGVWAWVLEATSSGLWKRHLATWLLPPCRQRAGCEASCGT